MDQENKGFGFYIKVIHNMIGCQTNNILKKDGLTLAQMDLLRYLTYAKNNGQMVKQKDLENYFHISNPTVSNMLDRMEAKGLIVRAPVPSDKRSNQIVPTLKGEKLVGQMFVSVKEYEDQALAGMSESEIAQGISFLKKIIENIMNMKEEDARDQNPCRPHPGV